MKKQSGFLPLVTGIIAGAAAVFFSEKKNRELASNKIKNATKLAKEFKKKVAENPEKVMTDIKKKAKIGIKKVEQNIKKVKSKLR